MMLSKGNICNSFKVSFKRSYFAYPSKKYAFSLAVGRASYPVIAKDMDALREEVLVRLPVREKSVQDEWNQDPGYCPTFYLLSFFINIQFEHYFLGSRLLTKMIK